MKQYIFFDMDGTLCDSEGIYAQALKAALKSLANIDITQEVASSYSLGCSVNDLIRRVSAIYQIDAAHHHNLYKLIGEHFYQLREQNINHFLITPMVSLFRHLASSTHDICIVSGSFRKDIETVLKLIDVKRDIVIVANEDYQHGKPHPEPYLMAAKLFNVPVDQYHQIIVFEDSPVGVKSAIAAGMHVIGLQSTADGHLLQDHGAHTVLHKKDMGVEGNEMVEFDMIAWFQAYLQQQLNIVNR